MKFETYVTDESQNLEKYQSGNTNVAVCPAKCNNSSSYTECK
ncbi:MAG: hypothetical protein ACLR6O_07820 [Eubacterium sp.]